MEDERHAEAHGESSVATRETRLGRSIGCANKKATTLLFVANVASWRAEHRYSVHAGVGDESIDHE